MKEVIENITILVNKVILDNINPLGYFIAIGNTGGMTNRTVWILRYEDTTEIPAGWIFRQWYSNLGMNGVYQTQQAAIKAAFRYSNVYEFSTLEEGIKWLRLNVYI
jgi:hypothetical protein